MKKFNWDDLPAVATTEPSQNEKGGPKKFNWDEIPEVAALNSGQDGKIATIAKDVGSYALDKVAQAGRFVDRYTGAPIRAGIGDAQTTDDITSPFKAVAKQFGEDPEKAPTGKMLAQKAGVSDKTLSDAFPSAFTDSDVDAEEWLKFKRGGAADISASGAAGLGLDIIADPTNLIPGKAIAAGATATARGLKAAGGVAKAVANSPKVAAMLDAPGKALKYATIKGGSALTGMAEKNISKYIDNTDEINNLVAKNGGDMTLAADEMRDNLQKSIQSKIGSLGNDIKQALDKAPVGSTASNDAIITAMEQVRSGIDPKLYPGQLKEIDEILEKVKGISDDPEYLQKIGMEGESLTEIDLGALNADAANKAKKYLQDMAKGSYLKDGTLFQTSSEAKRAAKAGGREARKVEMQLAPDTAKPNMELARLHRYEQNANKNLIAPGKTESALLAAGAGQNARNAKNLKDIGEMTGYDALGEAEKLSAAKAFSGTTIMPVDTTGKSATRMAVGAIAGSFIGGPAGTAVGMALTSPATLKAAINAGSISKKLVAKLANHSGVVTDAAIQKAVAAAQTPAGQNVLKIYAQTKNVNIQETNKVADEKNLKGFEKFANDGANKIMEHDPEFDSTLLERVKKSKKGRDLLIKASELPPGSKAMDKLFGEIKEEAY